MFTSAFPFTASRQYHKTVHSQFDVRDNVLTKQASLEIHCARPRLLNAVMNLSTAYKAKSKTGKRGKTLTGERVGGRVALPEPRRQTLVRLVKLGLVSGLKEFSYDLEVTPVEVTPVKATLVEFRPVCDGPLPPHAVLGTFTMTSSTNDCTRCVPLFPLPPSPPPY
jgi:hypothetical protein